MIWRAIHTPTRSGFTFTQCKVNFKCMGLVAKSLSYFKIMFGVCLVLNLPLFFIKNAQAQKIAPTPLPSNVWSRVKSPTPGNPNPIGFYTAGCMSGGKTLPLDGTGYQVMRTSRHRYYGNPEMIQLVQDLGKTMDAAGSGILVGDMAQPRGGPLPYGHASHQEGLDVDIWFWTDPDQRTRKLTYEEREKLPFITMLDKNGKVNPNVFGEEQILKLKTATQNPHVERIFVNPAIKYYLCTTLDKPELAWLHKLRPWPGHDEHFHVRIQCPVGATACTPQAAVDEGDGCAAVIASGGAMPPDPASPPGTPPTVAASLPKECLKILKE
jgi:penicillin-insensitive murein endopeptidase